MRREAKENERLALRGMRVRVTVAARSASVMGDCSDVRIVCDKGDGGRVFLL